MDADLRAILTGLELLRSRPLRPDDFCGQVHRYELNPPLSEAEVRTFEVQHRIVLPSDYRDFLLQVGNGGAGPAYGVFKLGWMDGCSPRDIVWREDDGFVGCLSEPFPHTEAWNDLEGKPKDDYLEQEEDEYERQMNEFDRRYYDTKNVNGAIPICHLGCALRQWLVVTGPEAGHIWNDDRSDYGGLYPFQHKNVHRMWFMQWYRAWFDDAVARVQSGTG
jgi:hypothetical protein